MNAFKLAPLLLCCAGVAPAVSTAADVPPTFQLLRDSDSDAVVYHADEVPLTPGPGWLALDVVSGAWHLRPATMRGERAFDFINDDSPADSTGVRLRADPPHALVYLHVPGLGAGKVDTPDIRFKGHPRPMDDATALSLAFKGRTWRLDARRHELFLSEGASSLSFGPVASPDGMDMLTLLWAGDLDRDGRLDFVFETSGSNRGDRCVWLSSREKPGEPAGRAACWHTTGC